MNNTERDNFPASIKAVLAKRVGFICSNPDCGCSTSGPQLDPNRAISIGVAAHICAAASGGPRYNEEMSREERSSIANAIWLCQNCSALIDRDEAKFTVKALQAWKQHAEAAAGSRLNGTRSRARLTRFDKILQISQPEIEATNIHQVIEQTWAIRSNEGHEIGCV